MEFVINCFRIICLLHLDCIKFCLQYCCCHLFCRNHSCLESSDCIMSYSLWVLSGIWWSISCWCFGKGNTILSQAIALSFAWIALCFLKSSGSDNTNPCLSLHLGGRTAANAPSNTSPKPHLRRQYCELNALENLCPSIFLESLHLILTSIDHQYWLANMASALTAATTVCSFKAQHSSLACLFEDSSTYNIIAMDTSWP